MRPRIPRMPRGMLESLLDETDQVRDMHPYRRLSRLRISFHVSSSNSPLKKCLRLPSTLEEGSC